MIVRILGEGQYDVPEDKLTDLNALDAALEEALAGDDDIAFRGALAGLLSGVRDSGTRLPDESLEPSEAIIPSADSHAEEVRSYLMEDGVIPG